MASLEQDVVRVIPDISCTGKSEVNLSSFGILAMATRDRRGSDEDHGIHHGYPFGRTFAPPGFPSSAFSAPGGGDDQRRKKVQELLRTGQANILSAAVQDFKICDPHKALDLKSLTQMSPEGLVYELGYLDDILSEASCRLCQFIQTWLYQDCSALLQNPDAPVKCLLFPYQSKYSEQNDFGSIEQDKHIEFQVKLTCVGSEFTGCLDDNVFHTRGRLLLESADMNLAQKWLGACKSHHGALCSNLPLTKESGLFGSLRMVDVQACKVVTINSPIEYIALSYVWGLDHKQTFRSKKSNSFDRRGRLVDLVLPTNLPATIEDAITITRKLGYLYIWIDVLCIVQDDSDHKKSQIRKMGQIYSSSSMTIAAAGGDNVQALIPGIRAKSRGPFPRSWRVGSLELLPLVSRSKKSIEKTTWATRAWTFQERAMSKRSLIFTRDQMYFHCIQQAWCEDTEEDIKTPPSHMVKNHYSRMYEPLDSDRSVDQLYSIFNFMVRAYSKRQLSVAKDVLLAFQGTFFTLRSSHSTEFILGLPKTKFHYALLWQPFEALERRIATGSIKVSSLSDCSRNDAFLPTWTWAAWVGEVFYQEKAFNVSETRNSIQWRNSHYECETTPRNKCLGQPENGKILHFSTQHARFRVKFLEKNWDSDSFLFRIEENQEGAGCTSKNLKTGSTVRNVLILDDNAKQAGEMILDECLNISQDKSHCFILICECKTVDRTVWRSGWGGDLDCYKIDNSFVEWSEQPWAYLKVMMVVEERDVAYRVGVGTIHKEAWEKQKQGTKSFRLA